jgi:hypothetical protein
VVLAIDLSNTGATPFAEGDLQGRMPNGVRFCYNAVSAQHAEALSWNRA